ncbi:MAG: nucleoside-diphosphate kinase [Patescibacteria group bacterium]|nr:nucleoside-diphosphate kinase [Patescibacteria group bacterium]MDE2116679.1 nucleoside-diphosphate kinase [Patescibacteria group bacterium]
MLHPKNERTLVVIKPDGVERSLVGEIIRRFERVGLKIVAMKMLVADQEFVKAHYTLDSGWMKGVGEKSIKAYIDQGKKHPISDDPLAVAEVILRKLRSYITAGPVVAMVIEGAHAVKIVRKLVGSTEPLSSDVGTIRGDFVLDSYEMSDLDDRSIRNLIHASGSVAEAKREIAHWFKPDEIIEYRHVQEEILYGPNLDDVLG